MVVSGNSIWPFDSGYTSRFLSGRDRDRDLIVIDGQAADRSSVSPDCIVDRPILGVGLPGEDGIVADNVAGNVLDAGLGDLVGEVGEVT